VGHDSEGDEQNEEGRLFFAGTCQKKFSNMEIRYKEKKVRTGKCNEKGKTGLIFN